MLQLYDYAFSPFLRGTTNSLRNQASNLVKQSPPPRATVDTEYLPNSVKGHESNGCPQPRTTESKSPWSSNASGYAFTDILFAAKQCYHCQGLGHVQADCPTLRISGASTGGRCYSCGQPGHLAVSIYHPALCNKLTACKACMPK